MKTKFFKIVIPAFAIVLAVAVSAFTVVENPTTNEFNLIEGYIPSAGGSCEPISDVECQLEGDKKCTYGTMNPVPVFKEIDNTMCINQLSRIDL